MVIITGVLSSITLVSGAVNVFVGLRLAALQQRVRADSASLEVTLVKELSSWKESVLKLLSGYATTAAVLELHGSVNRDIDRLRVILDRIERRCEERGLSGCMLHRLIPAEDPDQSAGEQSEAPDAPKVVETAGP